MGTPQLVLHVDDDPEMLALSTATFRQLEDITLLTAKTATEAVGVISDRAVDCVVSDSLVLPDGVPFVEALRREDADVPIVLFTAKDWAEVADVASAANISEYVQKAGTGDLATVIEHVGMLVDSDGDDGLAEKMSAVTEALADHANATSMASFSLDENWELVGQWVGDDELGIVVVEAIESHAGLPAIEQPLYNYIDADALEELLRPVLEEEERPGIEVRFPYGDFELAITSTGDIFARPDPGETLY